MKIRLIFILSVVGAIIAMSAVLLSIVLFSYYAAVVYLFIWAVISILWKFGYLHVPIEISDSLLGMNGIRSLLILLVLAAGMNGDLMRFMVFTADTLARIVLGINNL